MCPTLLSGFKKAFGGGGEEEAPKVLKPHSGSFSGRFGSVRMLVVCPAVTLTFGL